MVKASLLSTSARNLEITGRAPSSGGPLRRVRCRRTQISKRRFVTACTAPTCPPGTRSERVIEGTSSPTSRPSRRDGKPKNRSPRSRFRRSLTTRSESVKRGRAVYERSNCSQCHGHTGLGDGPSAHELKDDWGNPIVPYDLTQGHIKCGDTGPDIYRVFITGLDGTPMPSFYRLDQHRMRLGISFTTSRA